MKMKILHKKEICFFCIEIIPKCLSSRFWILINIAKEKGIDAKRGRKYSKIIRKLHFC